MILWVEHELLSGFLVLKKGKTRVESEPRPGHHLRRQMAGKATNVRK